MIKVLLSSFILTSGSVFTLGDWYWRDYDGVIPADAIVAGSDADGSVYIGQSFCSEGLYVGRAYPSVLTVNVLEYGTAGGADVVALGRPKILCSDNKDNFIWIPITSSSTFHDETRDRILVNAGYHIGYGDAHVAIYNLGGDIKVGYTDTWHATPWTYFVSGTAASGYSVLTYGGFLSSLDLESSVRNISRESFPKTPRNKYN